MGSVEQEFGHLYSEEERPGIPIRLLVGLTYLNHACNTSDEETVRRWVENPYHQYLCGEKHFQHELPIDPSSLSRWRKRIGEEGAELILRLTVRAGLKSGAVVPTSVERVTVDTTVQEKAIAFPTDARLYNRSRERLVRLALACGLRLRQSYSRLGPQALRLAHKHCLRWDGICMPVSGGGLGREIKRLKTYLGRVYRDIVRKLEGQAELCPVFLPELALAERLLTQQKQDKHKLYSLHAPEVECIAKGKAHKKYEFGVKVSVSTTNRDKPVIGHMKTDGKLGRNYLLGKLGDKIKALLCGAGHNIRLILKKLREKLLLLFTGLLLALWYSSNSQKNGGGDIYSRIYEIRVFQGRLMSGEIRRQYEKYSKEGRFIHFISGAVVCLLCSHHRCIA